MNEKKFIFVLMPFNSSSDDVYKLKMLNVNDAIVFGDLDTTAKYYVREYIELHRLARARDVLRDKGNRILDIAVEYGFGNHETFTRAMVERV
ncbi:helix-turn-helix domain-containing protein [Geosporobacter ferrireducens]|uniref:HTH araC/xylS-type domain-containing protein n=1 Tax=Geosporobacter ferrireducens TaxID=1424294 RepID=A0A1D8GI54_9FIRM|nr:helix-turn-helix domain-containing protein [Geosporobacter ferrireducens]AOT70587.1 hypothetical protein Gferi_14005 [Geosporobacter ferrireducens]MTI57378.1 AraC family transcriptional regulator [Geosporobacter ferrireducens]